MDKLKHFQNAATRLVTETWKYEHGLSRLMHDDLHWLVVPQWVQYKLAVTVHPCLRHRVPSYLADYCVPVSEVAGCQHLRSARCHQLSVPQVHRSTFEIRAFSVAGPRVWKSLPNPAVDGAPNNLGETWRRICSLDIRSISALEVLHNHALQIDIYLLYDPGNARYTDGL